MKKSIKIWLLAILYQTVILGFLFHETIGVTGIIIPIELIGGLPGLLIFNVILHVVQKGSNSLSRKWFHLALGAFFAAILTSSMTLLFFKLLLGEMLAASSLLLVLPSGIATLISLLSLLNNFLKLGFMQAPTSDEVLTP